jgi:hypothetical protein
MPRAREPFVRSRLDGSRIDGREEWIARQAEAKLGARAFGASASNPPALRSALMERDKPRAQGARRGARREPLCGPEWESRARL